MRYVTIFILFLICSCKGTHTDYVDESTGDTDLQVDVFGDTAADMQVYITCLGDQIEAHVYGTLSRDSMNIIQDISVGISEFGDGDLPLLIDCGDAEGPDVMFFYADSYSSVADSILLACDTVSYDPVTYSVTRYYTVDEDDFPETLELWYDIKTTGGNASGKRVLKKKTREFVHQLPRMH